MCILYPQEVTDTARKKSIKAQVLRALYHTDWLLLVACLAASCYGIVLLYSVAHTAGSGAGEYAVQVFATGLGVVLALLVSHIDYELIAKLWPVWGGVALVLTGLTFTSLGLSVPGADDTAWLAIPVIGTFQPSELLKIAFIISFAAHLNKVRDRLNELPMVALLCLHAAVPTGLIVLQGDDGTALVFLCMFVSMLVVAGLRPVYMVGALTAGSLAVPVVWNRLGEDKKARFLCLFFVEQYSQTTGWQQAVGLTAIGAGRLWGVGYMQGGGHGLYARNNDFIFTVAGEEFGFVGAVALLACVAFVVFALLRDVFAAHNFLGMLMCTGVLAMIGFQSLINIGMNLRLLPVIGITLPFFSRGGSSAVTLYLGIGLALSVFRFSRARSGKTLFTRPS